MLQKDDFIRRLAEKGYTKRDASIIVDDFVSTMVETLSAGESISFRGFGSFEVRDRKERVCITPKTGEEVFVPAFKTVFFTPGQSLRRSLQGS